MLLISIKTILSILLTVMLLVLVSIWVYVAIYDHIQQKEKNESLHIRVVNRLLDEADEERPIVLSVRQDKIIERVADEMEKRGAKEWMIKQPSQSKEN